MNSSIIETPLDSELNALSDEQFAKVIDQIPSLSNTQVRRYMKLMSHHKPVNEQEKAARKVRNRKKAKVAKKSRKANRK